MAERYAMTIDRARFLAGTAVGVGVAAAAGQPLSAAAAGTLKLRWYGGGVMELATPDDATIVLVDAWIWNNAGYTRFGLTKPTDLATPAAYVASLRARAPKTLLVTLTHDHGDHIGDYFELLKACVDAGLPVTTVGQSDLMRVGLVPKFREAGLDPAKLVLNGGAGMNFGGTAHVGPVALRLVPAVHSCGLAYPPAGFIIDVGGTRVYASGDTDLFEGMALIGRRYAPQVAIVCAGGGPYTMNADDAAEAVRMVGARQAIPVHYGHNPLVDGPDTGDRFRAALARVAPGARATVMQPGGRANITVA